MGPKETDSRVTVGLMLPGRRGLKWGSTEIQMGFNGQVGGV